MSVSGELGKGLAWKQEMKATLGGGEATLGRGLANRCNPVTCCVFYPNELSTLWCKKEKSLVLGACVLVAFIIVVCVLMRLWLRSLDFRGKKFGVSILLIARRQHISKKEF